MSYQVDTAFVNQFRAAIEMSVQQKGSRLRPFVRIESQNSEFQFFDRIGPVEAQEVTGRHQDTPLISTPHDRRRVGLKDYDWADLVDGMDKIRMLVDPTSTYVQNATYALGRRMDDQIINAFFNIAYTGKSGQNQVAFPAANIVPANYVDTGTAVSSNLTIDKLRGAKEILDAYDNDEDELRIIACTANQIHSLLTTMEVTNSDYNIVKALVAGQVNTYMGFQFIRTQRLLKDPNGMRMVPCWIKSKMLMSTGQDITARVSERADKRYSVQAYASMSIGAVRMEEEGVVQILCDESKFNKGA